jgi:hypothetical protein
MTWAWAALSFAIWIALGWAASRRSADLRRWMASASRRQRALLGSVGLLVGLFVLVGGAALIASANGLQNGVLAPWAWIAMTILGAIFIAFQVLGAAALFSLALDRETPSQGGASKPQE